MNLKFNCNDRGDAMRAWISGVMGVAVLAGMSALPAQAEEAAFGFVYTTDLLPQGQDEIAQWATLRSGKSHGSFNVVEGRTEYEYGLTDTLQLAAYLDYEYAEANHDGIDRSTFQPETFAEVTIDPTKRFSLTKFTGISAEAIYRILSPYTDPVGLAVYMEPTIGPATRELESRVILQKNFMDDRLVIAFNTTIAQELRHLQGDPTAPPGSDDAVNHWDKETDVNFGLAASYRFAEDWTAGLEFQHEREWAGFDPLAGHNATNAAFYTGPTIHYGGEHFYATFTVLDQLPWGGDSANDPPDSFVVGGRNYADDFERFRVRLKFGWYF